MPKPFTNLSQVVSKDMGNYRVVSLPKGMEIIDNHFVLSEKIPTIVIIDDFHIRKTPPPPTNLTHGDFVTRYAVHGLEDNIGVLAIDVPANKPYPFVKGLGAVIELQRQHQNIAALNMSIECSRPYDKLTERYRYGKRSGSSFIEGTGTLDRHNIVGKREQLQALLHAETSEEPGMDIEYTLINEIVQALNDLVDLGVEVYLSSGNRADERVNLFALSNAQHIVSAYDQDNANTLFSTEQASGTRWFNSVFDEKGNLMYITDKIIKILPEETVDVITKRIKLLFFWFPPTEPFFLQGTSFASPLKMNYDLKAKFNKGFSL